MFKNTDTERRDRRESDLGAVHHQRNSRNIVEEERASIWNKIHNAQEGLRSTDPTTRIQSIGRISDAMTFLESRKERRQLIGILLKVAATDDNSEVRWFALGGLPARRGTELRGLVKLCETQDMDLKLRAEATERLLATRDTRALGVIVKMLIATDFVTVRFYNRGDEQHHTISRLKEFDQREVTKHLVRYFGQAEDYAVSVIAKHFSTVELANELGQIAKNFRLPEEETRRKAVRCLAQMDQESSLHALTRVLPNRNLPERLRVFLLKRHAMFYCHVLNGISRKGELSIPIIEEITRLKPYNVVTREAFHLLEQLKANKPKVN